MAQTSVTAAPRQAEVIQADRCGAGRDMRDTALRSKYKAVRTTTSALAASMSAEDQFMSSQMILRGDRTSLPQVAFGDVSGFHSTGNQMAVLRDSLGR